MEFKMEDTSPQPSTNSGLVRQIRRQWTVHEDGALAYKLQSEEISQHYSGNRTRNAIVREDLPRAKEEQEREEREALNHRFKQLNLLREQDEEDARIAKLLAEAERNAQGAGATLDGDDLDFDILDSDSNFRVDDEKGGDGDSFSGKNSISHDKLKELLEKRDEEFARRLQEELERVEQDQLIAIETQDRELAKMIYLKEKAKIKRARERAKLKAAASAGEKLQQEGDNLSASSTRHTSGELLVPQRPTSSHSDCALNAPEPPKIPKKSLCNERVNPVHFRAAPKSLPPNPSEVSSSVVICSKEQYNATTSEPVPPYMPMQGYNAHARRK